MFGKDDEDNNDTPSASKEPYGSNRREKIAAYLKDQQEKKMTPKLNIEKQHLSLFKEDLALKRKIMETSGNVDQQFLDNTSKMAKTMDGEDYGRRRKCNNRLLGFNDKNVSNPTATTHAV